MKVSTLINAIEFDKNSLISIYREVSEMVDLHISKELRRNIVNKNGFIELETEYVEGLEYAFYLTHFAGTEKTKYTEQSSFCFDIPFKEGRYTAIFYYKHNQKKTSYKVYFNVNDKKEIELKELVVKI